MRLVDFSRPFVMRKLKDAARIAVPQGCLQCGMFSFYDIPYSKGGSMVSSKSSRTQSEVMSHKKK